MVDSQLLEWMDGFLSFGLVDIFVAKKVSEQQGGIGDSVESYNNLYVTIVILLYRKKEA